jgi:hypothetical protein
MARHEKPKKTKFDTLPNTSEISVSAQDYLENIRTRLSEITEEMESESRDIDLLRAKALEVTQHREHLWATGDVSGIISHARVELRQTIEVIDELFDELDEHATKTGQHPSVELEGTILRSELVDARSRTINSAKQLQEFLKENPMAKPVSRKLSNKTRAPRTSSRRFPAAFTDFFESIGAIQQSVLIGFARLAKDRSFQSEVRMNHWILELERRVAEEEKRATAQANHKIIKAFEKDVSILKKHEITKETEYTAAFFASRLGTTPTNIRQRYAIWIQKGDNRNYTLGQSPQEGT